MGISTRYSSHQPLIVRNPNGSLTIRKPQTGKPFIHRLPTETQPLPTRQLFREIDALGRVEKPPAGFFAWVANWISEAVKTIFGNVSASTENHSLDTEEREITLLSPIDILPLPEVEKLPETVPVPPPVVDDLSLSTSDIVHTGSNMVHWGIMGATLYGVAPQITVPISLLASLSSDTISFLSLPKDAHWLRKALSIPVLSKVLINYNPWIARLFQATSFFNHVQHSVSKLAAVWRNFAANPLEAVKAGAAHLFNLGSDVFFTAESFGLVDLKPKEEIPPVPVRTTHSSNQCPPAKRIIPRSAHLVGQECPPKAIANLPCDGCGTFSVQLYLTGLLGHLNAGRLSGLKIDFGTEGLGYDAAHGNNWFEYYYCPVDIAMEGCSNAPTRKFTVDEFGNLCNYAENVWNFEKRGLPHKEARELIQKYFRLRPEFQQEIDQFAQDHFPKDTHLITTHFRATDKIGTTAQHEARPVNHEEMGVAIHNYIKTLPPGDRETATIFVATDEAAFADYAKDGFPIKIDPNNPQSAETAAIPAKGFSRGIAWLHKHFSAFPWAFNALKWILEGIVAESEWLSPSHKVVISPSRKSTNGAPLHIGRNIDRFQTGKSAIMDSILLSKGDALIRTSSNLSKIAAINLKDGAKEIEVSKRFYQDPSK